MLASPQNIPLSWLAVGAASRRYESVGRYGCVAHCADAGANPKLVLQSDALAVIKLKSQLESQITVLGPKQIDHVHVIIPTASQCASPQRARLLPANDILLAASAVYSANMQQTAAAAHLVGHGVAGVL